MRFHRGKHNKLYYNPPWNRGLSGQKWFDADVNSFYASLTELDKFWNEHNHAHGAVENFRFYPWWLYTIDLILKWMSYLLFPLKVFGHIQIRGGYNRIVLLVGSLAIKVPNLLNGERAFILGTGCNLREHEIFCNALVLNHGRIDKALARIYYRSPLGLFLLVKRYQEIIDYPLTESQYKHLPVNNLDRKAGNYALNDDGSVVILDYGHSGSYYVADLDEQKERLCQEWE